MAFRPVQALTATNLCAIYFLLFSIQIKLIKQKGGEKCRNE